MSSLHAARLGRRQVAMLALLLAFFMDLLDTTVINVAIPALQRDLGAAPSEIQWVIAGYSLAFALLLMTGARLGDIYGYKRLFLFGTAGFTAASALCGYAESARMLVIARFIQGSMAAMMVPQVLSLAQLMFPEPRERQGISAYYAATAGFATVAGPVLGALLITSNAWSLGWRGIFFVNVPVGLVTLVLATIYVPNVTPVVRVRLDGVGVVIAMAATLLLMIPLIHGPELRWPLWTSASLAGSVGLYVLFGYHQAWKNRRDGSALIAPGLLGQRSLVTGVIIIALFFAVVSGFFLSLTVWLQQGLGWSALLAGLTTVPFSIGQAIASGVVGRFLIGRFGRIVLSAGVLLMMIGLLGLVFTIRSEGALVTPWQLLPALVVAGLGMGSLISGVFPFVLSAVPLDKAGSASGVINTMNQAGGAIGVAAFGTVFFGTLAVQSSSGLGRSIAYLDAIVSTQSGLIAALGVAFAITWLLPARLPKQAPQARVPDAQPESRLHDRVEAREVSSTITWTKTSAVGDGASRER